MSLRKWFGPSQKEVWRQLADKLGASSVEGSFGTPHRIDVSHGEWTISLDCFYNPGTKTLFTRLVAPFINPDGFRFTIYRRGVLSGLGKRLVDRLCDISPAYALREES